MVNIFVFTLDEVVTGGTSGATGIYKTTDADRNVIKLSNVTGTFQSGEQLVQLDEEQNMNLIEQTSWNNLLANWDTIGLGARATTSGLAYSHLTAGDKPAILQAYHPMLIDYIKAMLYEDQGRYEISDRHMIRYSQNIKTVKGQFQNRQRYGAEQVQDVL